MKIGMMGLRSFGYGAIARGHEAFLGTLTDELVRRGHEVIFYGPPNFKTTAELRAFDKVPLEENPAFLSVPPDVRPDLFGMASSEFSIWSLADATRRGVDVVHTHNALPWQSQSTLGVPHVMTLHHGTGRPPEVEQFLTQLFTACFPSFANVEMVNVSADQRRWYPEGRFRVIHHGLDVSKFPLGEGARDWLVAFGRVSPEKGTHYAIEIAKKTGLPLKIAGSYDPANPYFEEQIKPQLGGDIEYLGELGFEAKTDLLKRSRAMLFPILWDEPFGMVLLESMACGTPVIAMKRGAAPEVIQHGTSGFLCDDVEQMASQVEAAKTLDHAKIRAHVANEFSVDKMVTAYEAVYKDAIARFTPPEIP